METKNSFKQGALWGKLQTSYPQGNVRVTSGSVGLLASIGDVSVIVRKIAAAVLLIFTIGIGNVWGAHTVVKAGDMVSGEKYIIAAGTDYYLKPASFAAGGSGLDAYSSSLTESAAWTFTKSGSVWYISTTISGTTYYLGHNATNNGVKSVNPKSNGDYTISETSSGASTVYLVANGRYLSCTSSNSNWRCYTGTGTGVVALTLYKAAAATPHTVTFTKTDGSTEVITEGSTGAGVTPPVMSTPCDGWAFQGWSEDESDDDESTDELELVTLTDGKYYPGADVTLYPVYTKSGGTAFSSYTLLSTGSTVTDGKYLISTGSYTMAGSGKTGASFTPSTTEATAKEYTITNLGSGVFTIKGPDNKYIGGKDANDGLLFDSSTPSTNAYKWKYPSNGIQNQAYTSRYIRAYGTTDFRHYKTSNGTQAKLYKRTEVAATYYYSYPTCCTPLGTINGSITLTQDGTSVTIKNWSYDDASSTKPAESNIDYYTVNLYASTDSYASVVKTGTCEYDEKSTGVTLTGLTYGVTYKIKISATGNTGYCPISETLVENINSTATETFQLACDVPTNVTASAQTSDGATLSWDDVATNYEYVVDQSSSDPAGSGTAVNGAHSVTLTGLAASTTYYFHVRTSCGNSVYSNWATASFSTTSAAYFPNRKTLFIEAGKDGSAWDASACVKAWFRDGDAGGEAVATQWLANAGDGKKIFATVIPSTGSYRYMTIQRFDPANNCSSYWNDNGAVSKADDGGSNVVKTTCSTNSCVSWSPSALSLYLRGEIDSWAGNLATLTDQNDGIWTASYNNYTATTTSLYFRITDSYSNMHGNGNTALSGMIVGSTYNITASYDVTSGTLTMSKDFVKGTVSFDLQGHGSAISALTNVTAGSTISAPSVPTDANYIFGGWYKEEGCTNAWNFSTDVVNESMTLYAKWYQVTLVVKDDAGTTLTGSGKPTLTRTGASLTATTAGSYVFKDIQITNGTGSLSATNVTNPTINSVSSDITVTATFWKPRTVTKGTGTGTSTFTISATSVAYNGSVTVTCAAASTHKNPWTLTVTPSDGATYTASGSDGSITISNITKDITVDLAYTAKATYTMTFSTKSGYGTVTGGKIDATDLAYSSGTVTNTLMEGQTLTFPSITSFTADECSTTFVGWSTNPSANTAPSIKAGDTQVLDATGGTVNYYAVYSQTDTENPGTAFDPDDDVDGDYYITNSNSSYYMSHSLYSTTYFVGTAAASKSESANKFHITKNNSGKFIISYINESTTYYVRVYKSSNKDYVGATTTAGEATALTISVPDDPKHGTYSVVGYSSRALMYREFTDDKGVTTYRFGNYSTGNKNAEGYSLLEFEPAAAKLYTTNPVCAATYAVTLDGGEGASVNVTGGNVKYNGGTAARFNETNTVSISATPSSGYTFTSWTITKDGTNPLQDVTSTLLTGDKPTTASTSFAMPAYDVTVTATFSPILVNSLTLKTTQTDRSPNEVETGSSLTMSLYPKEGGASDPQSHTLKVEFNSVGPSDALDKTYTWSATVNGVATAFGGGAGNDLATNSVIAFNKNTGRLEAKGAGTAVLTITANDGSGVSASVTITVGNVAMSEINVSPTSITLYSAETGVNADQNYADVAVSYLPVSATFSGVPYNTGSYSYVTTPANSASSVRIQAKANVTTQQTETVTLTTNNNVTSTTTGSALTTTISVIVKPMPKAHFVDIIHGESFSDVVATVNAEDKTEVLFNKNTPTHADVSDPGAVGHNNCERQHLHLVGWILKDWADAHPTATHSEIVTAGATNFYGANVAIDLSSASVNGKTFYAVWAKVVTNP